MATILIKKVSQSLVLYKKKSKIFIYVYILYTYEYIHIREIYPEYSLEGLMLKLKLQYFGRLMQRADLLEKTLMLAKIGGKSRRGQRV